ncbi:N-acetylmuramoyl-L-alanine amidase [Lentilactobacillus farraginis]|uniref:N-acetylmuramoyl-L-alanine amidase n=1 Tax=Lentilactobacillus farraginis DSM 18382 = JCM 14108 TaxID=1423743 RepID=X0Q9T5_9LACO|nr:N-acetylmuramoyl-L-alanine amidase [Lentilactobacillus farraginis]KRM11612.1 N-acetylmuramoyl-L-alanine amidase [Lentilactobacillus farraginis DSM 18382 = JCM 14108]GAF35350.1 N-acetylmuramoyl-L-alanine amidase [Lentilactobacillus farraginis DSM 18382 = JCM 14108]
MKKISENTGWIIATLTIIVTFALLFIALYANSVTVKVNQLNIRSGPAVTYSVKAKAKHGEQLQVISRQGNWIKVIYKHRTIGWVASWLVTNGHIKDVTQLSEATVVLDPGHGGSDSGALSANGREEKTYTLIFANLVAKKLRARGAKVIMTRHSDTTVPLYKRPQVATTNSANAFISFHFDSSDVANTASGFTCYYYHAGDSKKLAQAVNQKMTDLPLTNRGTNFGNYLVIRDNAIPAILIEGGYINTDRDFRMIQSSAYQNKVADDVVAGLQAYFKTH